MAGKKTKGKQRIHMKKIDNEDDRMTTFSKRRAGIYKKLNELILTCNVEVGLLVFTKTHTPFTFAHPSVERVYEKCMNPIHQQKKNNTHSLVEAYKKERISHLNDEYEKLLDALEDTKEKTQKLEKMSEEKRLDECWWKAPIEELEGNDIQQMHDAFMELHEGLCEEIFNRLHHNDECTSYMSQ